MGILHWQPRWLEAESCHLQIFAWMSVLGLSPRQGLELLGYFKTRVQNIATMSRILKNVGEA